MVEKEYSESRSEIYVKVRHFILKPATAQNKTDWAKIMMEIEGYNARVRRTGLPLINKQTLKGIGTKMTTPLKKERQRTGKEPKGIDPGRH